MVHQPLHLLLQRYGITQTAAARWCGVSQSTISRVLSGRLRPPPKVVAGLVDLLGAERPEELFDPAELRR